MAAKTLLDALSDKFTVGDGCWEWTASADRTGYGVIRRDGRLQRAHRVVYELMVGPIPEGLVLDHLCEHRRCVRPSHLEPVTALENFRRASRPSAPELRRMQTHCKRGHEFTDENTYRWRGGNTRACRACMRQRSRGAI